MFAGKGPIGYEEMSYEMRGSRRGERRGREQGARQGRKTRGVEVPEENAK